MMISIDTYMANIMNTKKTYSELIEAREELLQDIHRYESREANGLLEKGVYPSPQTQYKMHLEYLSALLLYMRAWYSDEHDDFE